MASKSGKSITTSVPTISIKFHANAEQIEELYGSDDEHKTEFNEKKLLAATKEKGSNSTGNIQDTTEGSPLKYLRLNKRSNSTEVSSVQDSSPPSSDPWKFFTDIKGKIAKSVEEKITEIKSRNQDDTSPNKTSSTLKLDKSKDNSSLSDSEELSESSLSKTCGIASTTEGVEMSTDDESTSSIKNDTTKKSIQTLRQRFKLLKKTKDGKLITKKDGTVSMSNLKKLYNVTTEDGEMIQDDTDEIENAIDPLDDLELLKDDYSNNEKIKHSNSTILKTLQDNIDNLEIDNDGTVNIKEIEKNWKDDDKIEKILLPKGFFDLRYSIYKSNKNNYFYIVKILLILIIIPIIYKLSHSEYLSGLLTGIIIILLINYSTNKKNQKLINNNIKYNAPIIKEYQAIKYEGWVNELPDNYDPNTYHISLTQPAFIKLEGNWFRISNSISKIPKRAMWNEGDIKKKFKCHRIYNLLGAKIHLLPIGLAKIRHWSKKYPILIVINNENFKFDQEQQLKDTDDEKDNLSPIKKNSGLSFRHKMSLIQSPQRFSKLYAEQDNFYTDLDGSISDTSSPMQDEEKPITEELEKPTEQDEDKENQSTLEDSWSNCTIDESPTETKIYIFGRTDREKEDWFRRLTLATHPQPSSNDLLQEESLKKAISTESILKDTEYNIYMSSILKAFKKKEEEYDEKFQNELHQITNVSWINAFLGRIVFDCMCDEIFTSKLKERVQRKLAAIRLPYFIEELAITELNLGKTSPLFKKISKPNIDDRGLWIDMEMIYEGSVVLTLMTKLNLMKLKQPQTAIEKEQQKSAIFYSDVDDSAESSSDDESLIFQNLNEVSPSVNKSKKLMKMVDRITESKLFQAATENKFIKRAMEGVSNTDLRLKVEIRALEGTLVINIPPPPSDRIWIGFRPVPELLLSAHPIVGERNITFIHVTNWIEKKLIQEFRKLLVIPNMEDIIIPIMMPKLPE